MATASELHIGDYLETLKVMVVDGKAFHLRSMQMMLTSCKHKVTICRTAHDALSMLRIGKEPFDLVFIDYQLIDMNGTSLLKLFLEEFDLPVIVTLESKCHETALKVLREGACFCLQKPVTFKEVRNVWQHAILKKLGEDRTMGLLNKEDRQAPEQQVVDSSVPDQEVFQEVKIMEKCKSSENNVDAGNSDTETTLNLSKKRKTTSDPVSGESSSHRRKNHPIWTPVLELKFLDALNRLGGDGTPTKVQELMKVDGFGKEVISSHLKWHRAKKKRAEEKQKLLALERQQQPHPSISAGESIRTAFDNVVFLNKNQQRMELQAEGSSKTRADKLNDFQIPAAKPAIQFNRPCDFLGENSIVSTQLPRSTKLMFHRQHPSYASHVGYNTGLKMQSSITVTPLEFPMITASSATTAIHEQRNKKQLDFGAASLIGSACKFTSPVLPGYEVETAAINSFLKVLEHSSIRPPKLSTAEISSSFKLSHSSNSIFLKDSDSRGLMLSKASKTSSIQHIEAAELDNDSTATSSKSPLTAGDTVMEKKHEASDALATASSSLSVPEDGSALPHSAANTAPISSEDLDNSPISPGFEFDAEALDSLMRALDDSSIMPGSERDAEATGSSSKLAED